MCGLRTGLSTSVLVKNHLWWEEVAGEALVYSTCPFAWCNCFYYSQFQVTNGCTKAKFLKIEELALISW